MTISRGLFIIRLIFEYTQILILSVQNSDKSFVLIFIIVKSINFFESKKIICQQVTKNLFKFSNLVSAGGVVSSRIAGTG